MNQISNTGIHCKVIWNDQIRRFQFSGTEFTSLQDQVRQLLGLNREFVLKYKDNEGDMITVSSTEELACAIDISKKTDGGLIRFTVFPVPETEQTRPFCHLEQHHGLVHREFHHPSDFPPEHGGRHCHRDHPHGEAPEHGSPFCHRGRGRGRWGGGSGRWSKEGGDEFPCKNRLEKRKAKLTFKRDMWKAYLTSLEQQAGPLSPDEEKKKLIFREKVTRMDEILAQINQNCPPKESCEKSDSLTSVGKEEKFHYDKDLSDKKFRKCHKNKEYKQRKNKEVKFSLLSDEAKAEIKSLKIQINEKKPAIWGIQAQLKEKKFALRSAFESDQKDKIPQLKEEIAKLKQEKREKKNQIAPLQKRIHHLKSEK